MESVSEGQSLQVFLREQKAGLTDEFLDTLCSLSLHSMIMKQEPYSGTLV